MAGPICAASFRGCGANLHRLFGRLSLIAETAREREREMVIQVQQPRLAGFFTRRAAVPHSTAFTAPEGRGALPTGRKVRGFGLRISSLAASLFTLYSRTRRGRRCAVLRLCAFCTKQTVVSPRSAPPPSQLPHQIPTKFPIVVTPPRAPGKAHEGAG